jgi:hypothetical protein
MWGKRPAEGDDFRPVYSPAGFDAQLRGALEELRAGRWLAMRTLLAATGEAWTLRTSRTQVLGVVAAGSQLVEEWLKEEPESADARVMRARVGVERAVRAHREGHYRADELEKEARQDCYAAAGLLPADPVPWICLIALAQLDHRQERSEHRERAAEPMLPPGPWRLLYRVYERDRYNREAHHRMLHFVHARTSAQAPSPASSAAATDFVRWVSSWAPAGSPLLALPLYAYVERFRRRLAIGGGARGFRGATGGQEDPLPHQQWTREPIVSDVRTALHGWFERTRPEDQSVADLNHLAHALFAARQLPEAAPVFTALGPFFTPQPWQDVAEGSHSADAARAEFSRARARSIAAAS